MNAKVRKLYERIKAGDLQVADLDEADRSRCNELIRLGRVDVEQRGVERRLVARHASTVLKGGTD